jgi:hypothetical protein
MTRSKMASLENDRYFGRSFSFHNYPLLSGIISILPIFDTNGVFVLEARRDLAVL